MKAVVKSTGEIVDVTNLFDDGTAEIGENTYMKVSQIDMGLDGTDGLDMSSEQRMRYELAKAAMQGGLSNSNETMVEMDITKVTSMAIRFADKMIKELKKTSNKYELG